MSSTTYALFLCPLINTSVEMCAYTRVSFPSPSSTPQSYCAFSCFWVVARELSPIYYILTQKAVVVCAVRLRYTPMYKITGLTPGWGEPFGPAKATLILVNIKRLTKRSSSSFHIRNELLKCLTKCGKLFLSRQLFRTFFFNFLGRCCVNGPQQIKSPTLLLQADSIETNQIVSDSVLHISRILIIRLLSSGVLYHEEYIRGKHQ